MYLTHNSILWAALLAALYIGSTSGEGTTSGKLYLKLTHICLMDFPILINWTSPFRILGVSGVLFLVYFISIRNSCKQTV